MRIGFDARWYNDSGVGTYVAGLLNAFTRVAGDCEVVVLESPTRPLPLHSYSNLRRLSCSLPRYSVAEQLTLPAICRREGFDIFHEPFYVAPLAASCPTIVTFHDVAPFHFPIYGFAKRNLVRAGYRAAAARAAGIITCSSYSARDICSTLHVSASKVFVTYYGVDANLFHRAPAQADDAVLYRYDIRKPYVLLLGARNWRLKNFEVAFRALARVRKKLHGEFSVVFCGSTDALADASIATAAKMAQPTSIGPATSSELASLYRNADVFLFPSRFEGFGLPLVEAMSCGCPVVSSNATSLAEVAGGGAITVSPDDIQGMADAVTLLLTDQSAREWWKARALRRASNFSFDRTAHETLNIYREVLGLSTEAIGETSPQGSRCQKVR